MNILKIFKKNSPKLYNNNFTIVSNNCWGGFIYKRFKLQYNSPFIGLFIFAPDYIYLLKNFNNIINNDIRPVQPQESRYYEQLKKYRILDKYPIGKLDDNVEIHFLHYKTFNEAKEKWDRRVKRINFQNLLIKYSDKDLSNDDLINEFDKLDFEYKIAFCAKEFPKLKSVIYVEKYKNKGYVENEWKYYDKYIDIISILNSMI
ncbi:DUF1919 domain-containing protein [Turicibacter sanguinis]|uniref:DUF1919 domain-containing protein n=2 Tax=Turicibacter sanguinis TaxID=154288 RepID=A0A6G2CFE7_9FIRM|nr:DUF1919 domain-containing protein [Turicibacter sanguinis]KAB3587186.1 DUF1919 domain-containing protein [Phocaeicola vulgatus]EFF63409.1 conserved hypothetical protein [Turicibacter sanguinis PC909]MCU7192727.1 DUF1919 domain-containing protein [Turicibacter sanguinis]MCU7203353.1 DUF1919 domain-containing protein [Turicibacter sanguinis]MCU7212910.1 DUF1919 domain-containing protein [Turicibacter sanguinis]